MPGVHASRRDAYQNLGSPCGPGTAPLSRSVARSCLSLPPGRGLPQHRRPLAVGLAELLGRLRDSLIVAVCCAKTQDSVDSAASTRGRSTRMRREIPKREYPENYASRILVWKGE